MKICVLDGYVLNPGDLSWDNIAKFGELTVHDRTGYDDASVISSVGDAEIILTGDAPVSAAVLDACPNVKFIGVMATGYNAIDTGYARKKGIPVCNVPAYGTTTVAQYAISLLLEICGRVGYHSDAVKAGRWISCPDYCFWDHPLIELAGKTMGIIGFGRIGMNTGKIAKALGMDVLAYSRSEREEGRSIAKYVGLDTLLTESDVICLHCPLLPETENIINRDTIAKMKKSAYLINVGRGPIINDADLKEALDNGVIAGAGLDVLGKEPIEKDNPLGEIMDSDKLIITPHVAWASYEARYRLVQLVIGNGEKYLAGDTDGFVVG